MTAPAAPVITFRSATAGSVRLRWPSVTGAATYKVYRDGVYTGQNPANVAEGHNEAVVTAGPGDSLTVTALNSVPEESAASNAIVIASLGSQNSFPPSPPRGPYRSPFG